MFRLADNGGHYVQFMGDDGISKAFPIHHGRDMRLILDDISLEIRPGER
jgi:hypothetical protein